MGIVYQNWQRANLDFVRSRVKAAKRECHDKCPDYKRMVLRDLSQARAPFPYANKSLRTRRGQYNRNKRGKRHRLNRGCFCCCSSTWMHTHHMIQLQHGGLNDIANLIRVCKPCHDLIHGFDTSTDFSVTEQTNAK